MKKGFYARFKTNMKDYTIKFLIGYHHECRECAIVFGFPFWIAEIGWRF